MAATVIDGARNTPSVCCFFAALNSLAYESLEGGAGRGGATVIDFLLGAGGDGSVGVLDSLGVGDFFTRGGTGGIGLLGAPRVGTLGDCGATGEVASLSIIGLLVRTQIK
jgi:hypothetical protein